MQRNLLSVNDLSKQDVLAIFKKADSLRKQQQVSEVDLSKLGALLFFEASTRTRIGFEAASWKMGVKSIVIQETKLNNTMSRAESVRDTIRTLDPYVSFFCIRHPDKNIFSEVVPFTKRPVINCGNGYEEHPTQALIDAYSMWSKFGNLDGLLITMVGELKYSRAVHSLLLLLAKFSNITVNELSPMDLCVQTIYKDAFRSNGNTFRTLSKPTWGDEQVVYASGFPPKNPSGTFSQSIRNKYKINAAMVKQLSTDCIILNALPRIDEIDKEVDDTPNAYYFKQNELSLYVRMAVIERYCL